MRLMIIWTFLPYSYHFIVGEGDFEVLAELGEALEYQDKQILIQLAKIASLQRKFTTVQIEDL